VRYRPENTVIGIGRCYGMEMNVEKTNVMGISRQLHVFPVKLMIHPKQLENVESFKYLCSMLQMMVHKLVKLNTGLLWQKLPLTRRGLFLLAKWNWN
jgi:hypothetical protein